MNIGTYMYIANIHFHVIDTTKYATITDTKHVTNKLKYNIQRKSIWNAHFSNPDTKKVGMMNLDWHMISNHMHVQYNLSIPNCSGTR